MSLTARCWSPVPGDQRLAFDHERDGDDTTRDLESRDGRAFAPSQLDLDGAVSAADWWPDGSALLLQNIFEGRSYLYRYELATGELESIPTEPGYIWKARVRPDGRVWFLHEQGIASASSSTTRARRS